MRLIQHAWSIPLEPRVRLLPEGRLEAIIYAGDETAVSALLREEPAGIASERREYLLSQVACRKAPPPAFILRGSSMELRAEV